MEHANDTAAMPMRATRSGASRKLLTRKAIETAAVPRGEPLEASFPLAIDEAPDGPAVAPSTTPSTPTSAPAQLPPAPAAWSSEDEAAFQVLLTRRKAAGHQRRGKDLSAQILKPGAIQPNADTVVAAIVALVAARGEISRDALLSLMATTTFPHPKAKPHDVSWCQGYVAGAVRNGFLELSNEPSTPASKAG